MEIDSKRWLSKQKENDLRLTLINRFSGSDNTQSLTVY